MTRNNPVQLSPIIGLGLLIGIALLTNAAGAAEPKPPADMLLAAKNFWQQTGAQFEHDLDADVAARIRGMAQSNATGAELRLRAVKVACDLAGNSRPGNVPPAEAQRAVAIAMAHVEAHLGDETVRKFSPQLGFTHLTVSHDPADGRAIWVLIETTDPARRGGLNIEVDPKTGKVLMIHQWGKVTAPPPAPIA